MCDCIARVNKFLAGHNSKIMLPMLGPQIPFVETQKLDEKKRGKPMMAFATFCPFCGEKYPVSDALENLGSNGAANET